MNLGRQTGIQDEVAGELAMEGECTVFSKMWMSDPMGVRASHLLQIGRTCRVYRVLPRSDQSHDFTLRQKYNIQYVLEDNVISRRYVISGILTLILEVGRSASAARFLSFGSSFRQCNEEVLMARSNSSRSNKDVKKPSVPMLICC